MVYAYAVSRFDRRFHIPNGSSAPGHYSGSRVMASAASSQQPTARRMGHHASSSTLSIVHSLGINREADVFGDDSGLVSPTSQRRKESEWERAAVEEMNKETIGDA